jgi:hypothetical protein
MLFKEMIAVYNDVIQGPQVQNEQQVIGNYRELDIKNKSMMKGLEEHAISRSTKFNQNPPRFSRVEHADKRTHAIGPTFVHSIHSMQRRVTKHLCR